MKEILVALALFLGVNMLYAEDILVVTKTDGKQYVYPKDNVDSLVSTSERQYVHLSFPLDDIASVKYTNSEDFTQESDTIKKSNPFFGHFYATSVSPTSDSNLPQYLVMYFVTEDVVFLSTIIGELTCTMKFNSVTSYSYSVEGDTLHIEGEGNYDYSADASCFFKKGSLMYTVFMKVK